MGDLRRMEYERRAKEWFRRRSGLNLQTRECSQNIRSLHKREGKLLEQKINRLDMALRLLHADYKRDIQNVHDFQRTISARSIKFDYKSFGTETPGKYMHGQFQKSWRRTIAVSAEDALDHSMKTTTAVKSDTKQNVQNDTKLTETSEPSGILKQTQSQREVSENGKGNARKSLKFNPLVNHQLGSSSPTDRDNPSVDGTRSFSKWVPSTTQETISKQSQRLMAALLEDHNSAVSSRPWSKQKNKRVYVPRPMSCIDKPVSSMDASVVEDRPKTADVAHRRAFKPASTPTETRFYKNLRDTYKAILEEEIDPATKRILALRAFEFINNDSLQQRVAAMCTKIQQL